MKKQTFSTLVVLSCVSISKQGIPFVHSVTMLPFIHFMTAVSEIELAKDRALLLTGAVTCGIGLAKKYPALNNVDYPKEYFTNEATGQAWLNKQLATFGERMEIELLPSNFSLTETQRNMAAEIAERWMKG